MGIVDGQRDGWYLDKDSEKGNGDGDGYGCLGKQDTEWSGKWAACMSSICTQVCPKLNSAQLDSVRFSSVRFGFCLPLTSSAAWIYCHFAPAHPNLPNSPNHPILAIIIILPISGLLLLLDVLAMALFSGLPLLAAFLQRLRFVLLPQRS